MHPLHPGHPPGPLAPARSSAPSESGGHEPGGQPRTPDRASELDKLVADLAMQRGTSHASSSTIPSAPSAQSAQSAQSAPLSTGFPQIDQLLGGGFPCGRLSEITGPSSSGRTSLALTLLAETTRSGALAAVVDRADAFDPSSAASTGVQLDRVLWARAPATREALRCAERLLQTEGFPLVLLDLIESRETIQPAAWIRLARMAAGTRSALVLLSHQCLAGPQATITLALQPAQAHFTGTPLLLEELESRALLVRHRTAPIHRTALVRLVESRAA